ncbi:hypothetical protein Zmor_021127 [Zophobas morio]|uniref:Uncharacterized protein n=1 Tax=Zophobas morio TaxID=2755281 RepID=A0AA38I8P5_9CUCU|nr:hypothetical protein Zmor_021127 [Zophobas morio]
MAGGTSNENPPWKRCKKSPLINAIKCIKCDNSFHESCAKLYVNAKTVNKSAYSCCEELSHPKADDNLDIFWDATDDNHEKVLDSRIFKYILRQKDELITALREKNLLLEEQLLLIKSIDKDKNQPKKQNHTLDISADDKQEKREEATTQTRNGKKVENAIPIHPKRKEGNLEAAPNRNQNGDQTLKNDKPLTDNWTEIKSKRKSRNSVGITGKGTWKGDIQLKGAEKKLWICLSRTAENTSTEDVLEYLKSTTSDHDFVCEKLQTTRSKFPAFKIGAPWQLKEVLGNENFWPENVRVSRYNFPFPRITKKPPAT